MTRRLSASDREFFSWVSQAAFANPFGLERDELDRRIAGGDPEPEELLPRLIAKVEDRLGDLDEEQHLDVRDYDAEDRRLLEHTGWFHVFHYYADAFDEHIEDQLEAGTTPLRVTFADVLDVDLAEWGFDPERRRRTIELFFQIRRAFHFIGGLAGPSDSMRALRERLWSNVFTYDIERYERLLWDRMEDFSTLLLGETGTGKGAAAAAIGRSGFIPFEPNSACFEESFVSSFVPLNLSEFPEGLLESELFGHKKGAFTGAVGNHEGALARVNAHGVVFLDEIGEVSQRAQIKLLRVLQERTFSPVGSHELRRFSGRVVAATHRSLPKLRGDGHFRDDFYYRLCSDVIEVPPLRTRLAEDSEELTALLGVIVPRLVGDSSAAVVDEVADLIRRGVGRDYDWPGNVRELEQCARRVLLHRRCERDRRAVAAEPESAFIASIRNGELDAKALLAGYCRQLYDAHGTYEHVARITGLDRRTAKKHVTAAGD